jgi:hypothetical protein
MHAFNYAFDYPEGIIVTMPRKSFRPELRDTRWGALASSERLQNRKTPP